MKNRIIVVVRGGLVQAIHAGDPSAVDADILDYDHMEAENDREELQRMKDQETETGNLTAIY